MAEQNPTYAGSVPEAYDELLAPAIFEPYAPELVNRLGVDLRGPVLEIACGTGVLTRCLRTHLRTDATLVASDLSDAMLDYARSALDPTDIEWRKADAAALPFDDGYFEAVACQFGLMFVPDKQAAFSEARRVLRPRGKFVFCVWDSLEHNPPARIAHETLSELLPADPPGFYNIAYGFYDRTVLRALLDGAPFVRTTIESITLPVRTATAASFAEGMVRGSPVLQALRDRQTAPERVVDELSERLGNIGGYSPFESSMRAIVVLAHADG